MISFSKEYSFDEFSNLLTNYPRIIMARETDNPYIMSYYTQNDTIISIINNVNPNIPSPHRFYKLQYLDILDDGPHKIISLLPEGSQTNITLWPNNNPGIRFKIIQFDGQKRFWSLAKKIIPVIRFAGPSAQIRAAERTYTPGNAGAKSAEERFNIARDIESAYNTNQDLRDKVVAAQTLQKLNLNSNRNRGRSPNRSGTRNRSVTRSRSQDRGGKKSKKKIHKKTVRKGLFKTRKYKKR
uniref:Uncharacterized protein n=1 Tax=viral metagenome TaxID=1070528 RepID=A0A6C0AZ09_9ZZZZ|tara:strand:+ start:2230 stop:2949 length:720 start_codon:yes stop_codon:yes gene_type:complete